MFLFVPCQHQVMFWYTLLVFWGYVLVGLLLCFLLACMCMSPPPGPLHEPGGFARAHM